MTRLFVNVYTDKNEARNAELVECLAANKESFDEVIEIHGRPTYREYFEKINEVAGDDDISIVSNLDIVFEIGSFHMINGYLKANEVYALSRWDLRKSGDIVHFDRDDSQDAWCFRGKVMIPTDCDFGTGRAGCIGKDALVSYNRGKRSGCRKISIQRLYEAFNGKAKGLKKFKTPNIPTFLKSFDTERKTVFLDEVTAVTESGLKQTIKILFSDGSNIVCTPDHRIMNKDFSFVAANEFKIGDDVPRIGSMRPISKGGRKYRKRKEIYVKHHPHAHDMKIKRFVYKKTKRARLVFEANINNLSLDEFVKILNTDEAKSKSLIFTDPKENIHHIDGDTMNDSLDNLEMLSHHEHLKQEGHSIQDRNDLDAINFVKVVSVENMGVVMTYDITMKSCHHNFLANNVFVHNCDNAIADRLARSGYIVLNPSKDIMTLHIHSSEVRNYTRADTVLPPYLLVKPHHLNENPIYRKV